VIFAHDRLRAFKHLLSAVYRHFSYSIELPRARRTPEIPIFSVLVGNEHACTAKFLIFRGLVAKGARFDRRRRGGN
jgi:hypothetical protein